MMFEERRKQPEKVEREKIMFGERGKQTIKRFERG